MSAAVTAVLGNPKKNQENLSDKETDEKKQDDAGSSRHSSNFLAGEQPRNFQQQNGHRHHATVDLSNAKNLAEFLRIEEIVSSAVSKHLDKLSSLLGSKNKDAGYNGAAEIRDAHESKLEQPTGWPKTSAVSHIQSANETERCDERSNENLKREYRHVPTQDRMSVLAQKYLKSRCNDREDVVRTGQTQIACEVGCANSVGEDVSYRAGQICIDASEVGCANSVGIDVDDRAGQTYEIHASEVGFQHGEGNRGDFTSSEPSAPHETQLQRHWYSTKKVDLQRLDVTNLSGGADPPFLCTVKKPSIQYSKSLSSQVEDHATHGVTRGGSNDPPSSNPQDCSSTLMQPALLLPIPVIHYVSSSVPHGPWIIHNISDQSLYNDLVKVNDGYLVKPDFQDLPESKCTRSSSSGVDQTSFLTANCETSPVRLEKTVHTVGTCVNGHDERFNAVKNTGTNTKNHFFQNSPAINRKSIVQGKECLDCGAQFSENSKESVVSNKYFDSQFPRNNPVFRVDKVNNGCFKSDVKIDGKITVNNGCLKCQTPVRDPKHGTQNITMKSNTHGSTLVDGNSACKSPANAQIRKHRSLPNLAMIRKRCVAANGTQEGQPYKPPGSIQRRRTLSDDTRNFVNYTEKRCGNGSTTSSKLEESNIQSLTDVKCPAKESSTKNMSMIFAKGSPSEPRLTPRSQSLSVSSVSPRYPSSPSYSPVSLSLGNQRTLKKSVSTTPDFLEKYRILGLFCEGNCAKEKLRMTSRIKDPCTRNKPVVVSPHSGMFSPGKESLPKQSNPREISSKAAAMSGSRLQRSVSMNDISMKRGTGDRDVSFKSTSEKIRELSSSLENLVNKVADISRNALMRHKGSGEESDGFLERSRACSLENLGNQPWKSMDNLLTPEDPFEEHSFVFCKHLEAENMKPCTERQRKRASSQESSPTTSIEDNDVFFNDHVLDTSLQTSNPTPMRHAPESRENSRNLRGNSEKYINVRQTRGSNTSDVFNDSCTAETPVVLDACGSSDIAVQKEVVGTSGSQMDHCESAKMPPVQNTVESSETLETPEVLTIPEKHEITRASGTLKTPESRKDTMGTSGIAVSPGAPAHCSVRTLQSWEGPELPKTYGQHGNTRESGITRMVNSPETPQQSPIIKVWTMGENEILRVTPEVPDQPKKNEIVGVSRTSRIPVATDLPKRNGIVGVSRTSRTPEVTTDPPKKSEIVGVSRTSRTPVATDLPKRNGIVGVSRTSRTPEVTTDPPKKSEIVGVSRTSRTPEVTDQPERNGIVGVSRTSMTPEVTYQPKKSGIVGVSRTSRTPVVTDQPKRNEIVGVSMTSMTPEDLLKRNENVGVSRIPWLSGIYDQNQGTARTPESSGVSRISTSEVPDKRDDKIGLSRIIMTPELSGTFGQNKIIGESAGTTKKSVLPVRNEAIRMSGTTGKSEISGTAGRTKVMGVSGTFRTFRKSVTSKAGTPGCLGSNEEACVPIGASRTPEQVPKSELGKETQKCGEREPEVGNADRVNKSCLQKTRLRSCGTNQEARLFGALEKPCEKSEKSDWNGEIVCCDAEVEKSKYNERRKNSKANDKSEDNNAQCKPFMDCEKWSVGPTKISTSSTFSGNRLSSDPDSCHGDNVCTLQPDQAKQHCTRDTTERSPKNTTKKETRVRRKGVSEAPDELRARFISREEVNRLKMCFLSVQRQNNKSRGHDSSLLNVSGSSREERLRNVQEPSDEQQQPAGQDVLKDVLQLIHDQFAFHGYLNDGIEDVKMAEFIISHARSSEYGLRNAVRNEYKDLYWKDKLISAMYKAIHYDTTTTGSPSSMSPISQTPNETSQLSNEELDKVSPAATINSRAYSLMSMSRSGSERSSSSGEGVAVALSDQNLDSPEILPFGLDDIGDVKNDLIIIFNDYHRNIGVFLATTVNVLIEKLPAKIKEVQQQINYERRLKRRSWKTYMKLMNSSVLGTKETKDLDGKLRRDMEEFEWKIVYLRNVKRNLKNTYAERFGLDSYLLQSFIEQFSSMSTLLNPYIENNHLTFSPSWKQRHVVLDPDEVHKSKRGEELLNGSESGLLAFLYARDAMTHDYVKDFLYTYRYCMTTHRLLGFIQEKYVASVSLNNSKQQTLHQIQIQYRSLDLLAEWMDDYFDVDFKRDESLCQELKNFLTQEVVTTDKGNRGVILLQLLADKEKPILTCFPLPHRRGSANEVSLNDLGNIELSEHLQAVDENSNKKDKPIGVNQKYLLRHFSRGCETSILDYPYQILAEQLSLIQQDFFHRLHPIHFLNTRSIGVGISRNQSPNSLASHKDVILGFSSGLRRTSTGSMGSNSQSECVDNELIEDTIGHAQNISLWIAGEICGMASMKGQLALITKFMNVANYCREIRNFETAVQIVDALEMVVVRQLPVWRQVSTKTFEILDDLKAVKVLLKTDASWLIQSDTSRRKPTIPSALLFIMHVQQEELGGFLLANGMYKWAKLRSIAKLVDQIHTFKELKYNFLPNEDLQRSIKHRIVKLKDQNLHLIASENPINFHGPQPSSSSKKLRNALEKMRTSFG